MNRLALLGFFVCFLAFSQATKYDCHAGNGELRDALNAALQDLALTAEWENIWSDYDVEASAQCPVDSAAGLNYRWPKPTPGGTLDKVLSKKEIRVAIGAEWHDADSEVRDNSAWTILHNVLGRVAEWYSLPSIRVRPVFAIDDEGVFAALGSCEADVTNYNLVQEAFVEGTLRETRYDSLCGADVDGVEFSGFVRRDNCRPTKFMERRCRGVIEEAAKTLKYDIVRDSWAHDTQFEENALSLYNYYVSRPRLVDLSPGIYLGWENGFHIAVERCLGYETDSSACDLLPGYTEGFLVRVVNSPVFTNAEENEVKLYLVDPVRQKLTLISQNNDIYDVTGRPWFNQDNEWVGPYEYAGSDQTGFSFTLKTVGKSYGTLAIDQVGECPEELQR